MAEFDWSVVVPFTLAVMSGHAIAHGNEVRPYAGDAHPSPLLENIPGTVRHRSRIAGPMVRAGWKASGWRTRWR